jgi:hypothetical protein
MLSEPAELTTVVRRGVEHVAELSEVAAHGGEQALASSGDTRNIFEQK